MGVLRTETQRALDELSKYLSPGNENIRRGDLVASIRDLAQLAQGSLGEPVPASGDLAARRKALAEGEGFGGHDCETDLEALQLQAQRDLCEALKAEVWALQGRYSTTPPDVCPWVERSRVLALLDRALDPPQPRPEVTE